MTRALVSFAVLCAALFSHVALDIVGDYWLPTDAYDDVAHASRGTLFVAALAVAVLVLWRALAAALADLEGRPSALRTTLRGAVPRRPQAFVTAVILGTFPMLAGMGALDTWLDTGHVGALADCVGGSLPLAIALSFTCAALTAFLVWKTGRLLGRLDGALLRFVEAVVHRCRQPRSLTFVRRERAPVAAFATIVIARSRGLRAPPSRTRR